MIIPIDLYYKETSAVGKSNSFKMEKHPMISKRSGTKDKYKRFKAKKLITPTLFI